MATANPSNVATFMEKIDMLVARPMRYMAPRVTVTARPTGDDRQRGGHQAAEDEDQRDQRHGQAVDLDLAQVAERVLADLGVDGRLAGDVGLERGAHERRADLVDLPCTVCEEAEKLSTATELLPSSDTSCVLPVFA